MRRRPESIGRPARVLGYVRVSGAEQANEGTSLDAQKERIVKWCADRDYPAPDLRVEVESAGEESIERREELHRIIAEAAPGDLVAVALLDRWSRDIVFGVGSIRKLTRSGVGWHAIHEQIDASTPQGDEQLGIRMWVAESERRRIRDRTVGRREELRAKGLWAMGSVPYGYKRGSREQRRHLHLELDPDAAAIVVEIFQRAANGESLRTIVEWLSTVPKAPRHVATVFRSVKGRIYLGEMRAPVSREWIKGAHPAIIDLDVWQRAQDGLLGRRCRGRFARGERTANLLLRSFASCALCGKRIGIAWGNQDQTYYVCSQRRHNSASCRGPFIRTDSADDAAAKDILGHIATLRAGIGRKSPIEANTFDASAARARLDARLARAVQLVVDGVISPAELRVQRARLDVEVAEVARLELAATLAEKARNPVARVAVDKVLHSLSKAWLRLSVAERRKALALLAKGATVEEDGTLRWTWKSLADLIVQR